MNVTTKDKNALISGAIIGFAIPFVSNLLAGFGVIPEAFLGALSGAAVSLALVKLVFK